MSDDGFVFDDSDESGPDEHDTDETELFGTRTDESHTDETDRRFGTPRTDDTDSPLTERVPDAVSSGTVRTVAIAALAVVFVIAVGLVAYPLVMGAFDAPDSPDGGETTTEGSGGFADSTLPSTTAPATGTIAEEPAGTTAVTTVETPLPTTTVATPTAQSPSPTPTPTQTATPTPTPLPTRGFPAGDPVNETNESA